MVKNFLKCSPWLIIFLTQAANAQSASTPNAEPSLFDNAWHFSVGIPFWLSSITGDIQTPNSNDIPVSASFSQVVDHLKFGIMSHAEARKERLGFGADLIYSNIGDTLDVSRALPSIQTLNLTLKQVFAETFLFYRLIQSGDPHNPDVFDLLGGTRYYWTQSQINQFSSSVGWVDLMLGLRVQYAIGEHFSLRPRADFAFLGSKFTWNLIGEADWAFAGRWTVSAAYRAMEVDYENSSTQKGWDLNYHGPVIGASYNW